jgi:hypothetical protein
MAQATEVNDADASLPGSQGHVPHHGMVIAKDILPYIHKHTHTHTNRVTFLEVV